MRGGSCERGRQTGLLAGSLDHPIEAVAIKRDAALVTNTNADFGTALHLTETEIEKLIEART